VQLTKSGSACSINIGITDAVPGCSSSSTTSKDRTELTVRGVDVGDVHTFPWGPFVYFADPDGNAWAVQEIPRRS
jgi:hypothetical protein